MTAVNRVICSLNIFLLLMLVGCTQTGDITEIEQKLQDIRSKPQGQLEEPPKFSTYENFVYKSTLLRSPFQKPMEESSTKAVKITGVKVKPDLKRHGRGKGLEEYSLEALVMVGTIQNEGKNLYALILDPKKNITRVVPGMYMGKNDGKIISINERKIEMLEIIPDGQDGWVERPRSLVIVEP